MSRKFGYRFYLSEELAAEEDAKRELARDPYYMMMRDDVPDDNYFSWSCVSCGEYFESQEDLSTNDLCEQCEAERPPEEPKVKVLVRCKHCNVAVEELTPFHRTATCVRAIEEYHRFLDEEYRYCTYGEYGSDSDSDGFDAYSCSEDEFFEG